MPRLPLDANPIKLKFVPQRLKKLIPPTTKERLRMAEHNLGVAFGRNTGLRIGIRRHKGFWRIQTNTEEIVIASILRWRKYRNGILERINAVASEYGFGDHFVIQPNDVVIDIGANIGEFALFANRRGALVYAIEADDNVFRALQENVKNENIIPVNLAIWDKTGQVPFYSNVDSADSSIIKPSSYSRKTIKEAKTLDGFARQHGIGNVSLIKCDAEGAEPEVLMGATELLGRTDALAFDCGFERSGASTVKECVSILRTRGFDTWHWETNGRHMVFASKDHGNRPCLQRRLS